MARFAGAGRLWRHVLLLALPFLLLAPITHASLGDRSQDYQLCRQSCIGAQCPADPTATAHLSLHLWLLGWTCQDECGYQCMHSVTEMHVKAGIPVRQFHGKWPFPRIWGVQEPASVVASLLNLAAHVAGFQMLSRGAPRGYPNLRLWRTWSLISANAWVWSSVFHTRDLLWTEKMDYFGATAAILYQTYAAAVHTGGRFVQRVKVPLALALTAFFIAHVSYLTFRHRFNYGYNMAAMVTISVVHSAWWLVWCYIERKPRPYVWKCATAIGTTGLLMALELGDFPPLGGHFDAHSLWHFGTAPVTLLWYSFLLDDARWDTKPHSQ